MRTILYSMFTLCTYETRTRVIHNEHTQLIHHTAPQSNYEEQQVIPTLRYFDPDMSATN